MPIEGNRYLDTRLLFHGRIQKDKRSSNCIVLITPLKKKKTIHISLTFNFQRSCDEFCFKSVSQYEFVVKVIT